MWRLFRNTVFMALFSVIARAAGLIRYVFLVSFLTDAQFGVLKLATDIGGIGRAFMDGGLDQLVSRDGARHPDRLGGYFWTALVLKLALAILFLGLSPFVFLQFMTTDQVGVAMVYTVIVITLSLAGIARSSFTALERMEYVFYSSAPSRLVGLALVFSALAVGAPLVVVAIAIGSENVLWLILLLIPLRQFVSFGRIRFSLSQARWMVSESWPMAMYGFFTTLYLRLDTLMLRWLLPSETAIEHVGVYGKAQYPIEGISLLLTAYIIAVFPVFSRLHTESPRKFASLFRRSSLLLAGITIPLSILLGGWADGWLSLFPNKSPGSVPVLSILAMALNFSLLNVFIITIFTASDRQRWLVLFTFLTVGVSFISNLALIPLFGNEGAAFASLGSQAFLFTVMLVIFQLEAGIAPPTWRWLGLLISATLSGVFCWWLLPPSRVLLLSFPFLACYCALVFLLRVVRIEDIQQLRRALARREE